MQREITSGWSPAVQSEVLLYTAEMLAEGFNLIDIFPFLQAIYPRYAANFTNMQQELRAGRLFSETTRHMRLNQTIQYQIQTVEQFGEMAKGLKTIAEYIAELAQHRKKIRQTLIYPISLMLLIIGMLFALRTFMLPQLEMLVDDTTGRLITIIFFLLEELPLLLMLTALSGALLFLLFLIWRRRTNPLQRAQTYVKIIIIGPLFRLYYAYFFAYEFSQLFYLGYSVQQIIAIFTRQQNVAFLAAFGEFLQQHYQAGRQFADSLAAAGVFTAEFAAIIRQGEMLNQLAVKMRLYSKRCLRQYFNKLTSLIKIIQNCLFVFVALTVIFVYLILMMPMLTMIGEI